MIVATKSTQQLLNENALLKKQAASQSSQIKLLEEQLAWLKKQIFGKRSERTVEDNPLQMEFEGFGVDEPKKEETQTVPAHKRRKPRRNGQDAITLPDDLPIEKQVLDLPDKEKICAEIGKPLVKIGEEVTKKIAYRPGSYFIKEFIRPKYALLGGGVVTAPLEEGLLQRCQADESFLADIMTKKFADHLPLYRISEILSREGIFISRQILCQWVLRCGKALSPLYEEMKTRILQSGNVFVDESPLKMQQKGHGKTKQAYMWVMAGGKTADPPYRCYNFYTDRKHSNAEKMLSGYAGVLHSDKYGAYEKLANEKRIIWSPCWSHIRRKFFEVENDEFCRWVLRKIRYLFMLEKIAWKRSSEDRLNIRKEKEELLIDELIVVIKEKLIHGKVLPKSKLKEALGYFCGLIPHLKNYLRYPYARMDNNVAERAVRPIAIGRKNWLFVGNEKGGRAAAVILSLVQSCRAVGINPREYLEDIMRRLMDHSAKKLYELLPDRWVKKKHQQK